MAIPFGYQGNLRGMRRVADTARNGAVTLGRIGMAATNALSVGSGVNTGFLLGGSAQRWGFSDPSLGGVERASLRAMQYSMGWMWYTNEAFEQIAYATGIANGFTSGLYNGLNRPGTSTFAWQQYNKQRGLYNRTMPLYNPTRRQVDFYVSGVFPGVLSEDGSVLPDGTPLAIPLATSDEKLKSAIAQGWRWGNWQSKKGLWIKFAASCGDGFIEIIDDVDSGIVSKDPVWPGEITQIEFSSRFNVSAYTRAHRIIDGDTGDEYILTRQVDANTIATFRNNEPFGVDGMPSEYDNPYGFVPLVYNPHSDIGTLPGGLAIRNPNKIEKLNSFASGIHRYFERQRRTPMFIPDSADVSKVNIKGGSEEEVTILTGTGAGTPTTMEGNLDIAAALEYMQTLTLEIERDHPESVMWDKMSGMSQVTAPGIQQLMGNVRGYLEDARSRYDEAEIRANEMLVAIAGFRFAEGKAGWAERNNQQQKFAPFGLDSYKRGDLDHSILPRPLVQPTREEQAQSKMAVAAAYTAMENAGEPFKFQIGPFRDNWSEDEIDALEAAQDEQAQKAMEQQQAMTQAAAPANDGQQVPAAGEAVIEGLTGA